MANIATNVSTGKPKVTGAVYVAPLGTSLPADATTELSSAFKCLGYVSEDGLKNSNDMSVSEIKAWGGMIVYRSLDGLSDEFKFALLESLNVDVLKFVYGDSHVTTNAGGDTHIEVVAEDPVERVIVFEIALRGGKKKRIVITDGAITGREEITYNDSDAIMYGITLSAYPNADGKTHDEYITGSIPSV